MAKKMYFGGLDDKARKVRKMNFGGTDNLARKVKKGYIGVGDVARPFFTEDGVGYYGTITPLSAQAQRIAAASNSSHAFFVGQNLPYIDAYDTNLIKTTLTPMESYQAVDKLGISAGEYAIFAGGYQTRSVSTPSGTQTVYQYWASVDAYNSECVHIALAEVSSRIWFAGIHFGGYTLIGGGAVSVSNGSDVNNCTNSMYAYDDETLVQTTITALSIPRCHLQATCNDEFALFGPGSTPSNDTQSGWWRVDAYNKELVRTIADGTKNNHNEDRYAATRAGDYAIFTGGSSAGQGYPTHHFGEAYDDTLIKTLFLFLRGETAANALAATTLGKYALVGGGTDILHEPNTHTVYRDDVDVCDENLSTNILLQLSVGRAFLAATTIGDYALFGGGYGGSDGGVYDTVDAFVLGGSEQDYDIPRPTGTTTLGLSYDSSDTSAAANRHEYYRLPKCTIVVNGRMVLASGIYGEITLFAYNLQTGETTNIITHKLGTHGDTVYESSYSFSEVKMVLDEGNYEIGFTSSGDNTAVMTATMNGYFEDITT